MSYVEQQRVRTIEAKVDRLRRRLAKVVANGKLTPELAAVLAGFLDLLVEEL